MMQEFLTTNRREVIHRCRDKVALRIAPEADGIELKHGITEFLDQLIETLRAQQDADQRRSDEISGPSNGDSSSLSDIGDSAMKHGRELLLHGFTVDQVVHDYGDLCQAVTELAFERAEHFQTDEFRTLNRCLDNAIADAVTEYTYQRDFITHNNRTDELNERLGYLAHESRNLLNSATLALTAMRDGKVGLCGATGAVLDRSLVGLRNLVDRSLCEVRVTAGLPPRHALFSLADFVNEVKLSASLEAHVKECELTVGNVDSQLAVDADRDLLCSAVGNILQNAFKFTHHHSEVGLHAYAVADRIRIDVRDSCGGLAPGDEDTMFLPFVQGDKDRSGLGSGLSIARRSVEANKGWLSVQDVPGEGCVFTIDLPRHEMAEVSLN